VIYWPIWELRHIRATHRYLNGAYQRTDVFLDFSNKTEKITLRPEAAYSWLVSALKAFNQKIQLAQQQENSSYFFDEDDFRDAPIFSGPTKKSNWRINTCAAVTSVVLGMLLFSIALGINSQNSRPSNL